MIVLFEGFLKWKKKDPYAGWLDAFSDFQTRTEKRRSRMLEDFIRQMEEQRNEIERKIKEIEDAKSAMQDKMFGSEEEKQEYLKRQELRKEKLKRKQKELSDKLKDVDPYGEEEWIDDEGIEDDIDDVDEIKYLVGKRMDILNRTGDYLNRIKDLANDKIDIMKRTGRIPDSDI